MLRPRPWASIGRNWAEAEATRSGFPVVFHLTLAFQGKRPLFALLLAAASCGPGAWARAQSVEELLLRPPVIDAKATPLVEEISYRQSSYDERGFNRVIDQVAVPTLTVYRPEHPAHRGAAVVICPGGGYQYVVIDREGHMLARYLQQQGITAAVLKYRLPQPERTESVLPLPQQDALAALQLMRTQASAWELDPTRIGILGCSAGGHLAGSAAVLGRTDAGSRPDFVVLLYPVVCMEGPYVHAGSRQKLLGTTPDPEQVEAYSLERRARPDLPPHFLVHARDDRTVPYQNSELLATALARQGVAAELLLVQSGGHGFTLGRDAESARWKDAFLAWLDRLP